MFVGVKGGLPYPPNFKDKHSSLFCHIISDKEESFITLTPGVNVIKHFYSSLKLNENKLECLPLPNYYKPLKCLRLWSRAYANSKHQAGYKFFPTTNTLAYSRSSPATKTKVSNIDVRSEKASGELSRHERQEVVRQAALRCRR
jgi:hypothetical protein